VAAGACAVRKQEFSNNPVETTANTQALQSLFQAPLAGADVDSLHRFNVQRLVFSVGKDAITATTPERFHAAAFMTHDRLIARLSCGSACWR
jgi:hypothetical protein